MMNCTDIDELSALWHSGELDASRQRAFDAHIAACPDCAARIRAEWHGDVRLREAIAAEPADTGQLEATVIRRIARERLRRRWILPAAVAAAAAIAAVWLSTALLRTPASPAVFAQAARDHTTEIIDRSPRHWQTDPNAIAALATKQGLTGADVKALEATGYKLERAKVCRLSGAPYMHLVYVKDSREVSVFMRVRNAQDTPDAAGTSGTLQLASFTRGPVEAIVVTGAPKGECAQFARKAEAAL